MFEAPHQNPPQPPPSGISSSGARPVFPVELETEFAESQAAASSGGVVPAVLVAALGFQLLLLAEHLLLPTPAHTLLLRGAPITVLAALLLTLPAAFRKGERVRPYLVGYSMALVVGLLVAMPFQGAAQLLPVQSGIAGLILLYGWLTVLPRHWAFASAAGLLLADFAALRFGPAERTVGLPVIAESLWAPAFAVALLIIMASVRYSEARRDFLLLRQAAFADLPQAEDETENLRHLDPQTKVANRLAFDMRFRAAWDQAAARRHSLALIFVSIDNLAEHKRDLGFKAAELIQSQIAMLLKDGLRRADDMVARFDNQHFVVMLPGVGTDGVTQISERLRGCVEEMAFFAGQKRHSATVTVGAASMRAKRGIPRDRLIDSSIHALDQARCTGINTVCVEGRGCIPRMS